jgi:hypothetical protein
MSLMSGVYSGSGAAFTGLHYQTPLGLPVVEGDPAGSLFQDNNQVR